MKRILAFYHVYKNSLYNVAYYKDVLTVDIKFSLKYFFSLALLAAFITTTRVVIPLIPKVQVALDNMLIEMSEIYPDDLVITSEAGEWKINQNEPFVIPTPDFFEVDEDETEFPDNFIVFDHQGTINDLREMDTLILVNKTNILAVNNQNKIEAYPLDSMPDGEVNKEKVEEALENIGIYLDYVPILIIVFTLIATFFYFVFFRLIYLVSVAFLLRIFGQTNKLQLSFGKYYQVAMHAITLPLSIELLFTLVGFNFGMPFWFFGINLIFGVAVVYSLAGLKGRKPAEK